MVGCLWTADTSNYTPCNYGFRVGAVGLFSGLLSLSAWEAWPYCRPSVSARAPCLGATH